MRENKICQTKTKIASRSNENQFIIIKFNNNKYYKISKIVLHKKLKIDTIDPSADGINKSVNINDTDYNFLPLTIEIMNNNFVLVTAKNYSIIKNRNNNTYPPIENELYKNFYNNLDKKGYVESIENGINSNHISSFRQWSKIKMIQIFIHIVLINILIKLQKQKKQNKQKKDICHVFIQINH